MKRVILATLFLATLFVLPAISQDSGKEADPTEAIATLTEELEKLQETVDRQGRQIKALEATLARHATEAKKLIQATEFAQKHGFLLPTPANDARGAFLFGVKRFAVVVSGSSPSGSLKEDVRAGQSGPIRPVEEIPPTDPRRPDVPPLEERRR